MPIVKGPVLTYLADPRLAINGMVECFTVTSGSERRIMGRLEIHGVSLHRREPGNRAVLKFGSTEIGYNDLCGWLDRIDNESVTDHLDIKGNPKWKTLYRVKDRDLKTEDRNGHEGTRSFLSVACRNCGVLLPMEAIQVDHQRPQAGGEIEAIVKVFRALGLTVGGPAGTKGLAGNLPDAAGSTLEKRYTLNDSGTALYTILKRTEQRTPGTWAALKTNCMNHYFNLRPLCPRCNASRGNPLKFPG